MLKHLLEKYHNNVNSYLEKSHTIGIVLLDTTLHILDCNLGFMKLLNPRQKPVGDLLSEYLDLDIPGIRCDEQLKISCSLKTGIDAINDCFIIETDTGFLLFCERHLLTESRALEHIGSINDDLINLQRESVKKNLQLEKLQRQLDKHVTELEATLARVKQLEGDPHRHDPNSFPAEVAKI